MLVMNRLQRFKSMTRKYSGLTSCHYVSFRENHDDTNSDDYGFKSGAMERERLNLQHTYLKPLLHSTLDQIPIFAKDSYSAKHDINILDIGFGTGAIIGELIDHTSTIDHLKNRNIIIHGIDNQDEAHNYVEQKFDDIIQQNKLYLHNIDITDINALQKLKQFSPSLTNGFDLITIRFVLYHIKDIWPTVWSNIFDNLLSEGSCMVVQEGGLVGFDNVAVDGKNVSQLDDYQNLSCFLQEFMNIFGHLMDFNVPSQLEYLINNQQQVDKNAKIIWKDEMDYGGKYGTVGHQVASDALLKLINIGFELNLIDKSRYQLVEKESQKLIREPKSQVHMWSKVNSMVIEKQSLSN